MKKLSHPANKVPRIEDAKYSKFSLQTDIFCASLLLSLEQLVVEKDDMQLG